MKIVFGVVLVLLFLTGCVELFEEEGCKADEDCVPATCCHADSCVNVENKPDCTGIMCTMECAPGTLDCGGKCVCEGNVCTAQLAEIV